MTSEREREHDLYDTLNREEPTGQAQSTATPPWDSRLGGTPNPNPTIPAHSARLSALMGPALTEPRRHAAAVRASGPGFEVPLSPPRRVPLIPRRSSKVHGR